MQNEELRRAQAELDAARARYFDLYDLAPVGYCTVSEQGLILEANLTLAALLGVARGSLVKRPLRRFVLKQDEDIYYRHVRQLFETAAPQSYELRMVKTDGTQFWAHLEATAARDEGGAPVCRVVLSDSPERKRAEEALRDADWRMESIIEGTDVGTWEWNVQTGETVFNEVWARIIGCTLDELGPISIKTWESVVHPDDLKQSGKLLERHFAGGLPRYDCECRMRHKDGHWVWVHDRGRVITRTDDGKPLMMFGTHTDITERKRAEEALRERDTQFTKLSSSVPGLIYQFTRRPDGTYCVPFATESIQDIFGCSPQDVREDFSPLARAILPEDLDTVLGSIEYSAEHLTGWACEYRVRIPGRSIRWMLANSTPEQLADGGITWYGFTTDITDRKRAEEEKAGLEAQLHQAQKLESVGRLAGGVAHDFNNMLGVILGHAEVALGRVGRDHPAHVHLVEIHKAAGRSANLTRQLLAFARKQTIAPKVLDLNETIEGILKMLRRLIGEDIQLAWRPEAGLWPVRVDPSQIDQILANLCVNARDAIADVGKLTIETANGTFDADYCAAHAGFVPGEYVRLAVSDDGCGMDEETLAHIFEPFFTTKTVGEGTGLGLATVYGIVKQNDGFINVCSEPGHGTTFTIYLPRYVGKAEQARGEDAGEPLVRGQETILLVEDERAILEMTAEMLQLHGYVVVAALTPGEAIRMAREHTGEIHLLMTDVVMPEMNGRDLAKNLLSIYPHIKRLFTSGYTADLIAHRGVLDDGVHFLQKPFSMKGLAAKVREALESE
jgi:PAS domain S-box-containing protein